MLWSETNKQLDAARLFARHFGGKSRQEIDALVAELWRDCRSWNEVRALAGIDGGSRIEALDVGGGLTTVLRIVPASRRVVADTCVDAMQKLGLALPADIEFVQTAAEALPFPSESFTHAFCFNALDRFETPRRALAEIHRVLKPGGRFVLAADLFEPEGGSRDIPHRHGFTAESAEALVNGSFDIVASLDQPRDENAGFHRLMHDNGQPGGNKREKIYVLKKIPLKAGGSTRELLVQCYLSGQIDEGRWQAHLREDELLRAYVARVKART